MLNPACDCKPASRLTCLGYRQFLPKSPFFFWSAPRTRTLARGSFLERPGKLSGPVSCPVSSRKLFGCFSKLPLISIPITFPVTCPVIYGRARPPEKLPGRNKCCKSKQNGGRGRTFCACAKTKVFPKTAHFSRHGGL